MTEVQGPSFDWSQKFPRTLVVSADFESRYYFDVAGQLLQDLKMAINIGFWKKLNCLLDRLYLNLSEAKQMPTNIAPITTKTPTKLSFILQFIRKRTLTFDDFQLVTERE